MPINRRILSQDAAVAAGDADSAEGLVLHLDANDEDSIESGGANTGAGSGTWFDISTHDLNVPLADEASNLQLHLNASDTTSYGGSGDDWTDISQNSNTASDTSPTFSSDTRGYFVMDGSNDYFTINYDASLYMTSNTGFTIEAWVNRDSDSEMYIIASDDGSTFPFSMSWNSTTHGYYGWISGSGYDAGSQVGLNNVTTNGVGEWDHVVMTQSSSDRKNRLYVNGTLTSTSSGAASGFHSTSSGVNVGAYHNETGKFDGKMSVIRIYNVELTASEVAQNFRADCFLSYDSTYDSGLALHYQPADVDTSANTWTDRIASVALSEVGTTEYDKEIGDFVDLSGYYGNDSTVTQIKDSNGDYTVEFFFNFDALSGNNAILGIAQTSTLRGLMVYHSASTFEVYNYANGSHGSSQFNTPTLSTLGITTSRWYHITIRIDNSTDIKIYVDGLLKATSTSNAGGTPWLSTSGLRIGAMQTLPTYGINGKVGHLKIYQGLLSEAEIAQNYLATKNDYPNDNNFTNSGATFTASSTPYYFDFDGINDLMTRTLSNFSYRLDDVYTVIQWLRADSVGSTEITFNTYGSSNGAQFVFKSGPILEWFHSGTSTLQMSKSVSATTWYMAAVTFDGTNGKLYLSTTSSFDSSPATDTGSGLSNGDDTNISIGGRSPYFFNGRIAATRVYHKALSASELTAIWTAEKDTF